MKYHLAATLAALSLSGAAYAQDSMSEKPKEEKWDVNAPKGATIKQVPINVDEGSWMDVDLSPDGGTIAFNLLGELHVDGFQRGDVD